MVRLISPFFPWFPRPGLPPAGSSRFALERGNKTEPSEEGQRPSPFVIDGSRRRRAGWCPCPASTHESRWGTLMDNPIDRSAAPVVGMELDALEVVLGLALPADYRAFLLAHNGGIPRYNKFLRDRRTGTTREIWLQWIYSVGREGLRDSRAEDVLSAYRARPGGLPEGLLPAASAHVLGSFGV